MSTRLLPTDDQLYTGGQESLGGNACTSLVVAIAEAMDHADETLQSLQFGTRAMFVENSVSIRKNHPVAVRLLRFRAQRAFQFVVCCLYTAANMCDKRQQVPILQFSPLLSMQAVVNEKADNAVTHQQLLADAEQSRQLLDCRSPDLYMCLQAVVNEKTDDAVTHQQLLAEMAEQADRAVALTRSLVDKESALGNLERQLEVRTCRVLVHLFLSAFAAAFAAGRESFLTIALHCEPSLGGHRP